MDKEYFEIWLSEIVTLTETQRRLVWLTLSNNLTNAAVELGKKGGKARSRALTSERRSEIAKNAAIKRWSKVDGD